MVLVCVPTPQLLLQLALGEYLFQPRSLRSLGPCPTRSACHLVQYMHAHTSIDKQHVQIRQRSISASACHRTQSQCCDNVELCA
jgi:hypothetical protein